MEEHQTTIEDIHRAREVLKNDNVIVRTPLSYSRALSEEVGCDIYLKLENLQNTGSHKLRGAYNGIASLSTEARNRGVVTASAGNHALGVAYSAQVFGIEKKSKIIVPEGTSDIKQENTKSYGVDVEVYGEDFDKAYGYAIIEAVSLQKTFIEPFDDWTTIAGQGTVGLEILEDLPDVDVIVAPVGGGGLIAGIAIGAKAHNSNIRVIGVQAEHAASLIFSLEKGEPTKLEEPPRTLADGIKVSRPGDKPFTIIKSHIGLPNVCKVTDYEIVRAIVKLLVKGKLIVEGGGAAGLAALLGKRIEGLTRKTKVAVVISGGNIDTKFLMRITSEEEFTSGRYLPLRVSIFDKPGQLIKLLNPIAERGVNIIECVTHRRGWMVPTDQILIELLLETKGEIEQTEIMEELKKRGYNFQRMKWE